MQSNTEILISTWKDDNPELPRSQPAVLTFIRLGFSILGPLAPRLAARLAIRLFSTPRFRARHSSSDEWLEKARRFEIPFKSYHLKAYEWGSGDRTILLVHGWESRGTALRSFVPSLLEQGFRVLAFDGPGHGDSGGKRTNIRHFAGAIRSIILQEGGVYGIIGHSFGGASTIYALGLLNSGLRTEKAVFIATPASVIPIFEDAVHTLNLPPTVARQFKNLMERIAGRPLVDLDASRGPAHRHIGEILLVHDQYDKIVPVKGSYELAKSWYNARLLLTQGYGHYRLMKNPDVIGRVAGFLGAKTAIPSGSES